MEVLILIICIMGINSGINIRDNNPYIKIKSSNDIKVIIYVLYESYQTALQIPPDKTYYQIEAGSSGIYSVEKGNSVVVSKEGLITPYNVTWYTYGSETTTTPKPGITPDKIQVFYIMGISEVRAKVGNNTFTITVEVRDYSVDYVENVLDSYIKTNVSIKKNDLEKFRAIAAFPTQYDYGGYWNYTGMIIFRNGDCWASSFSIKYLCDKVGITAHVRFGGNDPSAGISHMNVAALIDGKIYVAEAGYRGKAPRIYKVYELTGGYSYYAKNNELTIYQYDGYEEYINVPSTLDNKTVVGFDKRCFIIGESKIDVKFKKITLPDTVYFLGDGIFIGLQYLLEVSIPFNVSIINIGIFEGCDRLQSINIDKKNAKYSSNGGVLFDKNQTRLIKYPSGKKGDYIGPSSLERVEEYSFNCSNSIEIIKFRDKLNYIGDYAFRNSSIKKIYFFGDLPKFGKKPFINLNISIYYPKNNPSWKSANFTLLGCKDSKVYSWTPKEEEKFYLNKKFLIPIIVGGSILIIGIITLIICLSCRKKKSENLETVEGGLMDNKD